MSVETPLVTVDDVRARAAVVAPYVTRTPVLSASSLGARRDVRLLLKAELFQKTGSFKVRGVFSAVLAQPEDALARGLVSLSAGNHAAALAYVASVVGARATIVMPAHASPAKVEATRAYGGDVVLTDGNLLETCTALQAERGLTLIHPFDDPAVIAGAGGVGLEVLEDVPAPDLVVVPVGGGGLISGVAAAVKGLHPAARVVGVEPETADAMSRSLAAGHAVSIDAPRSVADGLAAPFAGRHTLAHVAALVDEVVRVPDAAVVEAMLLLMTRAKLYAEPSAAAGLAALLTGAVHVAPGAQVVVVVTGGNLAPETLRTLL